VLPRKIATFEAFENAMTLDIAMGGSTNTVLHLLAAAHRGEGRFHHGRHRPAVAAVPVLCKVAPAKSDVHMEDVHRAGGIMAILGELDRAGLLNTSVCPPSTARRSAMRSTRWDIAQTRRRGARLLHARHPAACRRRSRSASRGAGTDARSRPRKRASSARRNTPSPRMAASRCCTATSREDGCIVKTAGVDESILKFTGIGASSRARTTRCSAS
jgi:dihydroxy-acid dehydratase